ncbi:hypothetical protein [Vagococcus fluvialis]|uniref:hypothetical protein n=1 Tax=Vagococcus fluvialis TaxID=2738 RepID=UPI003D13FDC0
MDIEILVNNFRNAIEKAHSNREFNEDYSFTKFPRGCCGDTSDLLAHYLLKKGIRTFYVWGTFKNGEFEDIQSHAWLLLEDVETIIDITGDQFKDDIIFYNYDKSVYIGKEDNFHKLFNVNNRNISENNGIESLGRNCQPRLIELYNTITKYL